MVAMVVALVAASCGQSAVDGSGQSPVTDTGPGTQVAPSEAHDATDGAAGGDSPTAHPSAPTVLEDRAMGAGVVTVDDRAYPVEPVACGWLSTATSPRRLPLEANENTRLDFRLDAVAAVDDGAFIIDLDADYAPGIEALFIYVARAVPSDLKGNYVWSNERQSAHRLTVDGGRVRTDGPLEVLENSSDPTSIAHEVTIDVVCDRFGGALDDVTRLASETLGVALPDPAGGGPGSLTVNGADYELSTTSCNSSGDVTELNAESPDGAVTLYVSVTPLSDIVFVGIDGQRWIRDRDLEVVVKGDEMRSPGPIELVDQYTRASVGTITFAVTCR